jgi:hypothetical protein
MPAVSHAERGRDARQAANQQHRGAEPQLFTSSLSTSHFFFFFFFFFFSASTFWILDSSAHFFTQHFSTSSLSSGDSGRRAYAPAEIVQDGFAGVPFDFLIRQEAPC